MVSILGILKVNVTSFLEDVDNYFTNVKIVNFDMIFNKLSIETKRNYEKVKMKDIKKYPELEQNNIRGSLCRNIGKDNFYVDKETAIKLLRENNSTNIKKSVAKGRGRYLKICNDSMYASCW